MTHPRFGTFSIVACDPETASWGVAVQSKFPAVGATVPWAEAGVGAVATQADANTDYLVQARARLVDGATAAEVVRAITAADPGRATRQVGVVDAKGGAAAFTGPKCMDWAGQEVGDGFTCQGNILFGPNVVKAMARSYTSSGGDIADRLLAALSAGQREGGDRRGMQSAALLIVRKGGGYGGRSDRWVDLRVDDHPSPIEELKRIFQMYDLTMLSREDPATLRPIEGELAASVQHDLGVLGYYSGRLTGSWDTTSQAAFVRFLHEHNFENKERSDGTVWPSIVTYLRAQAAAETDRRTHTAPIVSGAMSRGPGAQPTGGPPSPPPAKGKRTAKK
jgi:uncharacterized Ntn-hydrolase superfamily protein